MSKELQKIENSISKLSVSERINYLKGNLKRKLYEMKIIFITT